MNAIVSMARYNTYGIGSEWYLKYLKGVVATIAKQTFYTKCVAAIQKSPKLRKVGTGQTKLLI